jgi:protein-S-isoprenylcysteine O-methyltransferase Ste14
MMPAAYGIWSVIRYFGLVRALGADHFRSAYRSMPLETRGAYRFSDNVMYSMVFLLFWAVALILDSPLALISAAFQHAYIWVHYYCTEEPDMRVIYAHSR